MQNKLSKDDAKKNKEITETIFLEGERLLPWINLSGEPNVLLNNSEKATDNSLDTFYLFPFSEITINNVEDDIPSFINERYQTILSVAYRTNITVATIYNSKNGKNSIYLGFKRALTNKTDNDVELFQSIINGILPGKKIIYDENIRFSSLTSGFTEGGIVTGTPILRKDDKDVRFKISSVIRSLYNKEYTLAIISNPIPHNQQVTSFNELLDLRDQFHSIAKQTKNDTDTQSDSQSDNTQITNSNSKTKGESNSKTKGSSNSEGISLILKNFNRSQNKSKTESTSSSETDSTSISIGVTKTEGTQFSHSLSYEQQNGLAIELEKIAEQLIERMTKGFSTGLWETTITFSTKDKITREIIGGSFVGELSKPSELLLPPSQIYYGTLPKNCPLFMPKINETNDSLFPKKLASYITSEELSLISSPPTESFSGFEIKKMPTLAVNDSNNRSNGIELGLICDYGNPIDKSFFKLTTKDLNKHLFVAGLTGSGKSTTVKHILKNLWNEERIPFLVLESAKRDYRQLLKDSVFENDLNVFTVGSTVTPIRFNPFYIQEGVDPLVHIDYLKAIFNASFSLYGPMPAIVEKCIHRIYLKKGWNLSKGSHPNFINEDSYKTDEHYYCFPILTDLKNEVEHYVKNELAYKGELQDNIRTAIVVRLESLSVGAKGMMFDTHDFFSIDKLLQTNTILEMESLADDDDKAFFVGLMLVLISQYRQRDNPTINPGIENKGLKHFLVIEEAHRLLKNVEMEKSSEMMGNPKGKAVELFANVISEMRSLGQGVAVVEQIPSKISPDVIKNSNTKIIHRLVSKDDQSLLAGSLSISNEDALYLNRLTTGHALCHKEGMERPVECSINSDIISFGISDSKVQSIMSKKGLNKFLHPFEVYEMSQILNKKGREVIVQFLNSLCTIPDLELKHLIKTFKSKIKQQINISDFECEEKLFSDYVVKHTLTLLTHGIYQRKNKLPYGLKKAIHNVFENENIESLNNLKSLLEEYWELPAKEFITKVVTGLVLEYQRRNMNNSSRSIEAINSYFLTHNTQVLSEVDKLITRKIYL